MIELMVAMLIGLIGTVIIFQVFEVSEGIKRTTTSGGDAQQNGAIALYVMEQDLRNSGMGFNETPYAGCNVVGFDSTQTPQNFPVVPNTMPMVPVLIRTGAATTTPDSLSVFYGSQTRIASPTTITANMDPVRAGTDPLRVMNRFGFREGDLILMLEPPPPPPGVAKSCAIMEVTGVPTTDSSIVNHDSGGYTLTWTTPALGKTARFNAPGGLGIVYAGAGTLNAARVFNLGNLYDANAISMPVYNTYSISSNTLTIASAFSANPPAAVADNIVHMRAQYGVDDGGVLGTTAGDGIVDRYVTGTPNWRYVLAVRIALVARSALAEKPSTGSVCNTTTDGTGGTLDTRPTWSGGTFDLSADPSWSCYRYKVFETTIPLRNWIWKSS
jgi:type IV pilus assembly protein PilW